MNSTGQAGWIGGSDGVLALTKEWSVIDAFLEVQIHRTLGEDNAHQHTGHARPCTVDRVFLNLEASITC